MSHTFDYNIYVDGELVDVGRLTVDVKDRIEAYYAAYSIVSEGAQPDEEIEVIMPEWYSAEYSQDGRIDLSAYIHYEWSVDTDYRLPEATIGHIDTVIEREIVYNYESFGSQAEEGVTMDVDLAYYDDNISVEVTYSWYVDQKVGYRSETDAYIYAYNAGHSDARADRLNYKPTLTDRERTDFKKIFKQAEEDLSDMIPTNPTKNQEDLLEAFMEYSYYDPEYHDIIIMRGLEVADDPTFQKMLDVCRSHDGIIDGSYPAEAYIIAIGCRGTVQDSE